MEANAWDERYRGAELVWTASPNVFVSEVLSGVTPGRALDIAAGEGRHAVWLATQGWQVTAVDFSAVGLQRAQTWAKDAGVADRLTTVVADVVEFDPEPGVFDLVLLAYLQLPAAARRSALVHAAAGVAVGGSLLVIAHDSSNLEHGHGGPPDPAVLYTPEDVLADLAEAAGSWQAMRAEVVERTVPDAPRPARDALVLATRVE